MVTVSCGISDVIRRYSSLIDPVQARLMLRLVMSCMHVPKAEIIYVKRYSISILLCYVRAVTRLILNFGIFSRSVFYESLFRQKRLHVVLSKL